MYSNIDPMEGISTIQKCIKELGSDFKDLFLTDLILKLLRLVMMKNIFKLSDKWWIQNICTTIGASGACAYAAIFFAYFEHTCIIPRYAKYLTLYVFYTEDIFLVWNED